MIERVCASDVAMGGETLCLSPMLCLEGEALCRRDDGKDRGVGKGDRDGPFADCGRDLSRFLRFCTPPGDMP